MHLAVMEAVLVAIIMLTAVIFVTEFRNPTSSTDVIVPVLDSTASDFLATASDLPPNRACVGDTLLEEMVNEGAEGNDET
jgi:hypothetical protein